MSENNGQENKFDPKLFGFIAHPDKMLIAHPNYPLYCIVPSSDGHSLRLEKWVPEKSSVIQTANIKVGQ